MLGIGGKFGSAKGMVVVPNIAGLSQADAQNLLESNGLKYGGLLGTSSTSNSSLNGKVNTQSIAAGTLVDYETSIGWVTYSYVAPPQPSGPTLVSDSGCTMTRTVADGTGGCVGNGTIAQMCHVDTYGVKTYSDGSEKTYICSSGSSYQCGTTASSSCSTTTTTPTKTCSGSYAGTPKQYSCSGGKQCTNTPYYDSCGNYLTFSQSCVSCCTAGLVGCTNISLGGGKTATVCTYRRSDCTTYSTTTTSCTPYSSTSCGDCIKIGTLKFKYCSTTTVSSNCSTSTGPSKAVNC